MRPIKCLVLRVCRLLGLFEVSAWLFRHRLQILCYHGFQLLDECAFRPLLFISEATFERRLRRIAERGLRVMPLGDAVDQLQRGTLPHNALVITIDDGFASTSSVAAPLLQRYGMPATVYVTTYYLEAELPIFRLAVHYVLWKAGTAARSGLNLEKLGFDMVASIDRRNLASQIIQCGEALGSERERQDLLATLAAMLGVDLRQLYERRLLTLMSAEEVAELAKRGVDIQLHTHRHRFSRDDKDAACAEILENQAKLRAVTGGEARHFCYPSGEFASTQWPWLEALGIESATTCLSGSNASETPRYGLKRFLDSEAVDDIEFDAELSGFSELTRALKGLVTLSMFSSVEFYQSRTSAR